MGKCLSGHRVDVFLIVEETRTMLQFRKEPFAQCLERQSQNLELNHCRGSSASPPCRKSCRRSCSPSTVRRETAYRPRHTRGAFSLRHSYGKNQNGRSFSFSFPCFSFMETISQEIPHFASGDSHGNRTRRPVRAGVHAFVSISAPSACASALSRRPFCGAETEHFRG